MNLPDYVTVGHGSYFADIAFHRWGNERISIGKYCAISQQVKMLAGGQHNTANVSTFPFDVLMRGAKTASPEDRCYEHGAGLELGSDVWVGFGATLVGNLKVGHGAVIAANATVFTNVPPYGIAVGNPARVTKYRFSEEQIAALLRIAWWNWPEEIIRLHLSHGAFYWPIAAFVKQFDPLGTYAIEAVTPEIAHV